MPARRRDPRGLVEAARTGDRAALARLLSLVERGGEPAREVGRLAFPHAGRSFTIGITGSPGAGKSTLTNVLVRAMRDDDLDVAVLAIDPSSPFSGGAILGDRVRMQDHALDQGVFIRSMASRGHLGGLALAVPEAIRVLDAAGRAWVVLETVGVGQVEVEVAGTADTTLVIVNPGWGDAVQANKAGLLEIADVFVINKADRPGAGDTRRDLEQMLDLSTPGEWRPPVLETVAMDGKGVAELWAAIGGHRTHLESTGRLAERRARRLTGELREIVTRRLERRALELCGGPRYQELEEAVLARRLDPYAAADEILGGVGA
jgi:LAO/AO transport system kinase